MGGGGGIKVVLPFLPATISLACNMGCPLDLYLPPLGINPHHVPERECCRRETGKRHSSPSPSPMLKATLTREREREREVNNKQTKWREKRYKNVLHTSAAELLEE